MSVARSVAEILDEHTTLEVECIDRMYLNLYVPILQREAGIAHFWRAHRGSRFPSGAQVGAHVPGLRPVDRAGAPRRVMHARDGKDPRRVPLRMTTARSV